MSYPELKKLIEQRKVILFVGSGVSAGLELPTWSGLISQMATELDYDSDIFATSSDSYTILAEYYKIKKGSIKPLLEWMNDSWRKTPDDLKKSKVHKLIADLKFPLIYTTNYDPFVEDALEIYGNAVNKIVEIPDIGNSDENSTQVIKYHGDLSNEKSIVLTESDYFDRLKFESPLDIKLRSDILGKSILFIGYSLTDLNIRLLLHKLSEIWKQSGFHDHQHKSYLFQTRPDEVQEAVLARWGVTMINGKEDHHGLALESFLSDLL